MPDTVSIGRFSTLTRISVRSLRHYDELGPLHPAQVDEETGYRSYRLSQANRAEAIRQSRRLDMPLERIREVLHAGDLEVVAKILREHQSHLESELDRHRRMLTFLESLVAREEGIMPYEVEVVEVPDRSIASLRIHTSMDTIGKDIGEGFGTLFSALGGTPPAGPPFLVMHDVIDDETDGDVEICVPVNEAFEGSGEVAGGTLEGGRVARTLHRGPYDQIAPAYHTVSGWVADHGFEVAGPPRETYLNDPGSVPPEELLTQVDFPIDVPRQETPRS